MTKILRNKLLISAAILVAAGGVTVFALTRDSNNQTRSDQQEGGQTTSNQEETSKSSSPTDDVKKPSTNNTPAQANQPTSSLDITTNISSDSDYVYVAALVEGTKSGSCKLYMTKSSQTLTDSKPIEAVPPYTGDYGCNLRVNRPSSGTWSIYVTATGNGKAGRSATTNYVVQ